MSLQTIQSDADGKEDRLTEFGFRFGKTSVHTSRTMMFSELTSLLAVSTSNATKDDYYRAIIEDNLLGKTTLSARRLTAERLTELYALDVNVCLFRVMRHFWDLEEQGHPVLSLLCALSRDTLLRSSSERILQMSIGDNLTSTDMLDFLESQFAGRFRRTTITSAAQNINSTWTQAGYLSGRIRKKRIQPIITPATVTFALFLAYLEGIRAQRLFDSYWIRVLNISKDKAHDLTSAAFQQGWLEYRRAGDVIDIRFPDLLTVQELELLT